MTLIGKVMISIRYRWSARRQLPEGYVPFTPEFLPQRPDLADRAYAQRVAVRYWEEGLTMRAIARQDGVSVDVIRAVMNRWRIPRRAGRQAHAGSQVRIAAVAELLA